MERRIKFHNNTTEVGVTEEEAPKIFPSRQCNDIFKALAAILIKNMELIKNGFFP